MDNDTKPPLYLYIPWLVNLSENTSSHSCCSHSLDSFHKNCCKSDTDLLEDKRISHRTIIVTVNESS